MITYRSDAQADADWQLATQSLFGSGISLPGEFDATPLPTPDELDLLSPTVPGELDATSLFLPAPDTDLPATMDTISLPEFGESTSFHLFTSPTVASLSVQRALRP